MLGYWYHQWGPGDDDEYTEYPDTCEPWPTPTWEECTQNCSLAKCHMMSRTSGYSQYSPEGNPDCPCERQYWEDTQCDGYDVPDIEASPGCGYHRDEKGCRSWDWQTQQCVTDPHKGYHCVRRVEGYSYFACTPGECNAGWDDDHGGQYKKNRLDHEWCHGMDCSGLWARRPGRRATNSAGIASATCTAAATLFQVGLIWACGSARSPAFTGKALSPRGIRVVLACRDAARTARSATRWRCHRRFRGTAITTSMATRSARSSSMP